MTLSIFPDINVWLALAYPRHEHHLVARVWYESLRKEEALIFCRQTQTEFLRLLTLRAVMGVDVKSQIEAWRVYDALFDRSSVQFVDEPFGVEEVFRRFTRSQAASPQDWTDSYLAAFAMRASLQLVTFDKALHARVQGSILLGLDEALR